MEYFIDDPLDVVNCKPEFSSLGLQNDVYLVGISNPVLGIDKPVLIFKHLSSAKEFISSHPLKDNCFYSISILNFYETCP